MYWAFRKYCHCTTKITDDISLNNGYFKCSTSGYITFRAHLYSTESTTDPTSFTSALTNWLYGQDTDKTITIYGKQYSVEPGPCGVTVPDLYAPACSTSTGALSSTLVAVIVPSVFAAMLFILSVGLIGYILVARR